MNEISYMNECTTRDIITMLVEKKNISIAEAIDIFYNSRTFTNLNNMETGLYFQSPIYVYDLLEKEISSHSIPNNSISNISVEPPGMPGCE